MKAKPMRKPSRTAIALRKIFVARKGKPIRVMFVCMHGVGASVTERTFFRQFLEDRGFSKFFQLAVNDEHFSNNQSRAPSFDYIVPVFPNLRFNEENFNGYHEKRLLSAIKSGKVQVLNGTPITQIAGKQSMEQKRLTLLRMILVREKAKIY